MRFFTPAWCRGELEDDEAEAVPRRYAERMAALAPTLPGPLRELAIGRSLHDALVRRAHVDHRRRRLTLELRAGDRQVGYFDRRLVYDGVLLSGLDTTTLAAAVRDPKTELLYDEVDLELGGRYVHRVLFHPYREVEVVFELVQFEDEPRHDQVVEPAADRYSESGAHAV